MLRFYIEVARTAFRRQLIYRWANIAGLLTNIVFGIIFSYVMIALYQVRSSAGGYDLNDAMRYVWLVQSMVMIVLTFGWYDLMLTIRSGEVVSDLSKPCDFYWYWFSREIGRSCYYLLYRGLPTYLAGMLLFRFGAPLTWQLWPLFLLSLSLGAMTGIAYRVLFNIAAFWLLEARAIGYARHRHRADLHRQLRPTAVFPRLAARHRRLAALQRPDERPGANLPGQADRHRSAARFPAPAWVADRLNALRPLRHSPGHPPRGCPGRLIVREGLHHEQVNCPEQPVERRSALSPPDRHADPISVAIQG